MVSFIRKKNAKLEARRAAITLQNDDRIQRGVALRPLPNLIKRTPRRRFVSWFSELLGLRL